MRRSIAFQLVLAGLLAGSAAAQSVYRITGPDGKVTFSDHPPTQGDATVVRGARAPAAGAPVPAAAAAPASPLPEVGPAGASKGAAKHASRADRPPAPGAPAGDAGGAQPLDAALQKSLSILLTNEQMVVSFEQMCGMTLPTSLRKYSGAADAWRARHATLLARRDAVLQDMLTSAERARLQERHTEQVRQMYAPIEKAERYRRIQWCDETIAELNSGKVDLQQNATVTGPLLAYRSRGR